MDLVHETQHGVGRRLQRTDWRAAIGSLLRVAPIMILENFFFSPSASAQM